MTTPFDDDIFNLADGVEEIYIDSSSPYQAIIRRITRAESVGSGLPDTAIVFMVESDAVPTIRATILRSNGETYTIVKAELRSHETRWVVFTGSISPPVQSQPEFHTINIGAANTEYSLALTAINSLKISARDVTKSFRLAFESGKVADSMEPFHTMHSHQTLAYNFKPALDFTLYVASPSGGVALELITQ
ncbi:MAG TPA: hypothetical protein VFE46_00430 [Pirellulales bacterium]|nr:hypothetical protein [Pirellulales bacterium]